MRALTDLDFNADSRELDMRLDIYFDSTPLEVTTGDYLIDITWLEEGSADSSNPFGAVSSDELSFRLYNDNGIFSPTNITSPYFGKIRKGVKVIPYIRAKDTDWQQLGVYYVSEWEAAVTGTYADITANDVWYQIFSSTSPNYPVQLDVSFKEALTDIYSLMGFTVQVSDELLERLPVSFITGKPVEFTQEMLTGALAFNTCTKEGTPIIEPFITHRPIRATLTDSDQIKAINAKQSTTKTFDGVELAYNIPNYTEVQKIIDITDYMVPVGRSKLLNVNTSMSPIWKYVLISNRSTLEKVSITDYTASAHLVSFELLNEAPAPVAMSLTMYGIPVVLTEVVLADDADALLKISNKYIQNNNYATRYKNILEEVVSNPIPFLELSIRGNPLLNIGDRIKIVSSKYDITFDGVIQRMHYTYTGGLTCEMVLMNSAILEGFV